MLHTLPAPSLALWLGFVLLPMVMVALIVAAIRHTSGTPTALKAAGIATLWLLATGAASAAGVLDVWSLPPRIGVVLLSMTALLVWAGRATWAERLGDLPLTLLVGVESFRIIVELLIHEAVVQGIASPTLTWTGTNFDIIPAVTALLLAPFADRVPTAALQAWNLCAAGILCITVGTALLATPTLAVIQTEPANIWIAGFPFVWLPAVLVTAAWLGHIVLFRRLRRIPDAASGYPHAEVSP